MIAALILFGLRLAPLYRAIAQVESERGRTSDNIYQIRPIYVKDVNRIFHMRYKMKDVLDRDKAEMIMWYYWQYYGIRYQLDTGMDPTFEVLARIHNGGPEGWRRKSTLVYWTRVKNTISKENHK